MNKYPVYRRKESASNHVERVKLAFIGENCVYYFTTTLIS